MRHKEPAAVLWGSCLQIAAIRAEPDCNGFIAGAIMRLEPVLQRQRIHILQAGALAMIATVLLAQPSWEGSAHEFIEIAGISLVFACIIGRMWSILYVGDKKNRELVTTGPYSMTRNPLYFFSILGATGVGLMYGSLLVAIALGFVTYGVLGITAAKEADYLRTMFGPAYDAYSRRTPMLWPKTTLYVDAPEVAFSPKALKRTLLDALPFLAVFPLIETVEYLHASGVLPTLVRLF
jgi:protein-S-isoprenylcysteine O-methyltransferase Ste14